MKFLFFSLFTIALCLTPIQTFSQKSNNETKQATKGSQLMIIYAGPYNAFGPAVTAYETFNGWGCSISIDDSNTGGPVRLQVYSSNDRHWREYIEGTFISGDVVKVRAASTGTGGYVQINVSN